MRSAGFSNPRILSNLMSKCEKEKRVITIVILRINKGIPFTTARVWPLFSNNAKYIPLLRFVSLKIIAFAQVNERYLTEVLIWDIRVRK